MEYLIVTAAMLLSFAAAYGKLYLLSGAILILAGVVLYAVFFRRSGMLSDPAALFSISWIGGMGISALKLSFLQTDWEPMTWLCLYGSFLLFLLGLRWTRGDLREDRRKGKRKKQGLKRGKTENREAFAEGNRLQGSKAGISPGTDGEKEEQEKNRFIFLSQRLLSVMGALTLLSVLAFCFEAWKLKYIPLFTVDTPHAYSYFHVSGVHYFTVACVLVPALFILYLDLTGKHCLSLYEAGGKSLKRLLSLGYGKRLFFAAVCVLLSLFIPLLCVSRFQLIFAAALAVLTKLALLGRKKPGKPFFVSFLLLFFCLLLLYVLLTVARAHSVGYLNGIFEMKDPGIPIFITQPYIYIANNFDNLNVLIRELPGDAHTLGLRMLFPLWALTGLKFLAPGLVSFPLYVTKAELTTVTLIYDAYYDLGLLGVLAFSLLLGAVCGLFWKRLYQTGAGAGQNQKGSGSHRRTMAQTQPEGGRPYGEGAEESRNPALYLFYAQLSFYLMFSFFTTWFSNPATWFYFALTSLIGLYLRGGKKA